MEIKVILSWGVPDALYLVSVGYELLFSSELSKFHTYNLISFQFLYVYFPFYVTQLVLTSYLL